MEKFVKGFGGYNLFFVMPRRGGNAHKSAERLLGIKWIREVLITEGDCGFVVKADSSVSDHNHVSRTISRIVGGNSRMAVCCRQYKK